MIANALLIGALLTLATPSLSRAVPSSPADIQSIETPGGTTRDNVKMYEEETGDLAKAYRATLSELMKSISDSVQQSRIQQSIALQSARSNSVNIPQNDNGRLHGKRQISPMNTDYENYDYYAFKLNKEQGMTRGPEDTRTMVDHGRPPYVDTNTVTSEQLEKREEEFEKRNDGHQIVDPKSFESIGDKQLVKRSPTPDSEEEFEKRGTRSQDAQSREEDDTTTSHGRRSLDQFLQDMDTIFRQGIFPRDSGDNHESSFSLIERDENSTSMDSETDAIMARDAGPQGRDGQILEEIMDVANYAQRLRRRDPEPSSDRRIVCYDAGDCRQVEGVDPFAVHEIISVPDPD